MKYIALFLLLISPCWAADVKYLQQGQPAPYTGYLITTETEQQFRLLDQKLDIANKKIDILSQIHENDLQIIDQTMQQRDLWKTHAEAMSEQLAKNRKDDFWKGTFNFILGAAITGLVSYGIYRSAR